MTSDKVKQTFRQIRKAAQAEVIYRALMEFDGLCSDSHQQREKIREFQQFLSSFKTVDDTEFAFIDLGCKK